MVDYEVNLIHAYIRDVLSRTGNWRLVREHWYPPTWDTFGDPGIWMLMQAKIFREDGHSKWVGAGYVRWLRKQNILEFYSTEPTIVFCWYNRSLRHIENYLRKKYSRPIFLVLAKDKSRTESWKASRDGILVSTIGTLSEGINLQHSSLIIMYEKDWVYATNKQAVARCARRGQTKRVRVYSLIYSGTIDANVHTVAQRRHSNALKALLEDFYVSQ